MSRHPTPPGNNYSKDTERTVHIEPGTDLNDLLSPSNTGTVNTATHPSPDYATISEALRVRPDEDIPPPPVCLSIQRNGQARTFGTIGNFSVIIGKAKSRKTFATSIALAAALKRDVVLNCFTGTFDENKQTVLYFDTEQGRYHVLKVVKRICQLANQPTPPNLLAYALRSLPTEQRLGFIQWHIYNTPNVGLVVIDGIRDTVMDINDNAEATERVGDLLRWTEQRGIHVLTVIHMNKSNDSIRGTIGTELQNKAETVVSISVDDANKDVSIVEALYCRDKEFDPFAFAINEQGLPYVVEDWQPTQRLTNRKNSKDHTPKPPRSVTPGQLNTDQHQSILKRAFLEKDPAGYKETYLRIKAAAEYFGHSFGESKAKEFHSFYKDAGYLNLDTSGKYPLYSLNTARLDSERSTEPEPTITDQEQAQAV